MGSLLDCDSDEDDLTRDEFDSHLESIIHADSADIKAAGDRALQKRHEAAQIIQNAERCRIARMRSARLRAKKAAAEAAAVAKAAAAAAQAAAQAAAERQAAAQAAARQQRQQKQQK